MAVYVDGMQPCIPNSKWKYKTVCHLMADTIKELHSFALGIGLQKAWFQNDKRFPHYDLTTNKRRLAVKHKVIQMTSIDLIKYFKGKEIK